MSHGDTHFSVRYKNTSTCCPYAVDSTLYGPLARFVLTKHRYSKSVSLVRSKYARNVFVFTRKYSARLRKVATRRSMAPQECSPTTRIIPESAVVPFDTHVSKASPLHLILGLGTQRFRCDGFQVHSQVTVTYDRCLARRCYLFRSEGPLITHSSRNVANSHLHLLVLKTARNGATIRVYLIESIEFFSLL